MKWPWRGQRRRDRELEEELRSHLQMAVHDRVERGEDPEKAIISARRELGKIGVVKDVTRGMWGLTWLYQFEETCAWECGCRGKAVG